ncbi:MAG: carbon storage regulator CsrA [Peptococcaceae bacterium]|nr:carbon storage regulator CsrA [Peptococcaceae bacterium]
MLVLTRKVDQKILIGDDIEITLVAISGDAVRIGINAPKEVKIIRQEILEEVRDQNLKAAHSPGAAEDIKGLLSKPMRKEQNS